MKSLFALLSTQNRHRNKFLIGCLGLMMMTFFYSCKSNNLEELPDFDARKSLRNDYAEKVKFIITKHATNPTTIESDIFIQNNDAKPSYIDLKNNLKLTTYNSELNSESTITADIARYYPDNGNVIVRNNVVVINAKGERMETEELIWNQSLERFYTEKFVKITMDDQVIYGDGLEANQDFTWFKITQQRGTIPVDESELEDDE